jgi:hypothetical protein
VIAGQTPATDPAMPLKPSIFERVYANRIFRISSNGGESVRVRANTGKPRRRKAIHEALRSAPLRL